MNENPYKKKGEKKGEKKKERKRREKKNAKRLNRSFSRPQKCFPSGKKGVRMKENQAARHGNRTVDLIS